MSRVFAVMALAAVATGCGRAPRAEEPITPAVPVAGQPQIPYPPELFQRRVEGEVMLYVVVDTTGAVIRDSTRIATGSGQAAFDAAALQAAAGLRFTPARRGATPIVAPIQVPVRFTLPDSVRTAENGARH